MYQTDKLKDKTDLTDILLNISFTKCHVDQLRIGYTVFLVNAIHETGSFSDNHPAEQAFIRQQLFLAQVTLTNCPSDSHKIPLTNSQKKK